MKTTKKLIILCLVLVMGIVAIMPSTFSWYDHNGSQLGVGMNYTRENLPVSAGTVKMETKKYQMNGNEVYYDEKGNKKYDGGAITGGASVGAGKTQYYGTTFTNTGTAPAYVNLYLSDFTNNPKNFIGTTAPSLTDKGISSSVHLTNYSVIRVYFQWSKANNWNSSSAKSYVVCTTADGSKTKTEIPKTNVIKNNQEILKNVDTYYVDLKPNTVRFYFATDGGNSSNDPLNPPMSWYRTKTITDVCAETGYYLTGYADDTTWNAQYATFDVPGGVSTMSYYDTVNIAANQKAYITLNKGINYTGEKASYSVGTNNYLTIDSATGLISAKGTSMGPNDWVRITATITGSLGDTMTVGPTDNPGTKVSNPSTLSNAIVSINIEVPGKSVDEDGKTVNGTSEVVWYIRNEGTATCSFNNIYYTK